MEYNYKKETEAILSMALILSNELEDLICYTDKRTKSYKKMKEMVNYLNEFERFNFDDYLSTNFNKNKKVFDIQIDIELLQDLHLIKEHTKKETLSETLNHFIKKFKNTLFQDYFVKMDSLKNISKINKKLLNSTYEEKLLNDEKSKILFSLNDMFVENNEKYLNIKRFYFLENEFDLPIYVSQNLTFHELYEFYNDDI